MGGDGGRMAELQPDVVFGNTVEGLFKRVLQRRLSAAALEQIRTAGIDLSAALQPAYPRETYYQCVRIAANDVYGTLPPEEAFHQLGMDFMKGFEETVLGRALLGLVRLLGPKRALSRMTNNFHAANNYMQTKLTELGPEHFELWLSQSSGVPSYFQAVIEYGLAAAGAKDIQVVIQQQAGAACTLACRWGNAARAQS